MALRVAEERGSKLGDEIGYSIRFDAKSGPLTRIKFMTEGTLVREMMADPLLSKCVALMLFGWHALLPYFRPLISNWHATV